MAPLLERWKTKSDVFFEFSEFSAFLKTFFIQKKSASNFDSSALKAFLSLKLVEHETVFEISLNKIMFSA